MCKTSFPLQNRFQNTNRKKRRNVKFDYRAQNEQMNKVPTEMILFI